MALCYIARCKAAHLASEPWAEFEFSAWGGASWRAWRARLARVSGSLRVEPSVGSRGKDPGQGVWGGLRPPDTFSQLKDPKSLLQVTVCQSCDS